MKSIRVATIVAGLLIIYSGCSKNGDDSINEPTVESPVETGIQNTSYTPAFAGQTRIKNVRTTTPFNITVITSALSSPWGIKSLPDGRLLIAEKTGTMRLVNATGAVSRPITGLPAVNSAGQGGLLGLCIDPNFGTNRMIYFAFSEAVPGGNITAVAKGRLSDAETTVENVSVIYHAFPAHLSTSHYGGRVVFDGTGNLLASTGERSNIETRPLAQAVNTGLGKIIRITTNGQPAPGNPTFSQLGALPELFSIGHRNPQGLAIHPITGDLWQSEHGARSGDEINRVQAGRNYGCPAITYGIEYGGQPIGDGITQQNGMEQPVYYWDPVISPSGMTFYSGNNIPEWENNLFIGSLSGQHIVRLVIEKNSVVGEERLLAAENQRFRDLTQTPDGALYALTDQGRVYKID